MENRASVQHRQVESAVVRHMRKMESFDTESFIMAIQNRPVIWDSRLPEYSNKIAKRKAWEEINEIFDSEFGEKTNKEKNACGSIQAVSLPATADVKQNFAGFQAVATGYGKTKDAQTGFPTTTSLHRINLNIIANAACQRSFDIPLHASHMCTNGAGQVGTCDGDSGGPLTVLWNKRRTLVGIVSFGLADACQSGYPSVYTRVTSFLTWIQANL